LRHDYNLVDKLIYDTENETITSISKPKLKLSRTLLSSRLFKVPGSN